ncbi:glycosyltransferase [Nocardioides zeae]|uniref:Glycosyltransferase n=1 Tax=Nocardioides zeae TaxID=1457234 RepID=A0A6P0HMS7_9ACTN|nr:glycosyltransferase [Nocardioides zeae]
MKLRNDRSPAPRARQRILLVGLNYAPETTGIAPYTAGIARALAEDHDVQVLTAHPHYPQWRVHDGYGGWRADVRDADVHVSRLRHYVPAEPAGTSRIVSELSFAARAYAARVQRPDLVIAVTPALLSASAAVRMAKRWGVPCGIQVQDIYSLAVESIGGLGGRLATRVRQLEAWTLRQADGVATIHDRMAVAVSALSGIPVDDVTVVRNWTHVSAPTVAREEMRRRLGWRPDQTVLLHAGNMGAKQGLENVVAAGRAASSRPEDVRVILMGDGSERQRLGELASGAERVEFMAPVGNDDFTNVLAAADVLCLNERPGLKEMCAPSKLTSYFATGVPVVAATEAESAAAHDVRASGAGLVVTPGDPQALLDGVSALVGDAGRERGSRGPVFAAETLSQSAAVAAYRSWAADLVAGKRSPST